jgi:6-phospho-beta-glucosidase
MDSGKIAIIGGGSPYVPGILSSFAQSGDQIQGYEISLMDISPDRLPLMEELGRRIVEKSKADLKITSTTEVKSSLEGSSFVLTNFRPGGLEGLRMDEEIPERYGILGQETCGPGGTFYALRSVPQVVELCKHMEDVCPDAWLINYTNPVQFVADAVRRETGIKCLSICDGGGNGLPGHFSHLLGVEREEITTRAAGTNHPANWLLEFKVGDEDGYPLIDEALVPYIPTQEDRRRRIYEFARHFLRSYGVYPANPGYLYPYYNHDEALADYRAGGHSALRGFMRDLPGLWRDFEEMARGEKPVFMDPNLHHTSAGHGDLAVDIIVTMATGDAGEFHVNIPNEGSVSNIPSGSIIETPALIHGRSYKPIPVGDIPRGTLAITLSMINWEELTVEAALKGDGDMVLQALLAHPRWPLPIKTAQSLCDEMLAAHSEFLPQFGG